MINFSFVILNHNQHIDIRNRILRSISLALSERHTYDVVIVDDGSDRFDDIKALEDWNVKVVKCPIRRNQSMSRNMGIDQSEGRYIFFIDGDDWYNVSGLQQACDAILETPDMDVYSLSTIRPVRAGGVEYRNRMHRSNYPSRTINGTTQYCVSRGLLERKQLKWDEEVYFWDSEDFYFWNLIVGNADASKSLDISVPVTFHPLYRGGNSDRPRGALYEYYLYMIKMCYDLRERISSKSRALTISVSQEQFVTKYRQLCMYDTLPSSSKAKIDNNIRMAIGGVTDE